MPKSYSIDFRKKILSTYLNKEGTNEEIAKRFKVSASTVKRIARRYKNTGKIELYLHNVGRKPKITSDVITILKQTIAKTSDLSLSELRATVKRMCKVQVSIQAIYYALQKIKLTYKKKSLSASQKETDENKKKEKIL